MKLYDLIKMFEISAKEGGASVVKEPFTEEDEFGSVRKAVIRTYGDVCHTLVDRANFPNDRHLPGYQFSKNQKNYNNDPVAKGL